MYKIDRMGGRGPKIVYWDRPKKECPKNYIINIFEIPFQICKKIAKFLKPDVLLKK